MKRKILGTSAVLAAVLLTPGSVFATDGLDYAKSVGQVDMGDTVNYVVEATSDGGYVAGGQTLQCFRVNQSYLPSTYSLKYNDNSWLFEQGELAPMEDCIEYQEQMSLEVNSGDGQMSTMADDGFRPEFYNYCPKPYTSSVPVYQMNYDGSTMGAKAVEPGYIYDFACVDYIAKFKQDGTKEWLTTVRDGVIPAAVGETSSDYRLLTRNGMLYTFARANGDEGLNSDLDIDVEDAIINQNGTITAYRDYSFGLIGSNGQVIKVLEGHSSETENEMYGTPVPFGNPIVRSKNGFITAHIDATRTIDDETGESVTSGTYSIVEISRDLNTITPIAEFSIADLIEEDTDIIVPLSADQDNNIAAIMIGGGTSGPDEFSAVVLNKDGDIIATTDLDNLVSGYNFNRPDAPLMLDGFIAVDPAGQRLVRFSPQLEITDTYGLGEGEKIYDAVVLKDGSVAAVGRASTSTDNYTVEGSMNGTYLRLTAAKKPSGATNPNTLDDANMFALGGGVAVAVIAGVVVMLSKRR